MNKKLRELYNQVVGDDKLNLDSYLAEKFAELIVQECLEVVDKVYHEQTGMGFKLCRRQTPYQEIVDEIQEHFWCE